MTLDNNTHTPGESRSSPARRPGRIVALAIAWLLLGGGFAAWCLVFPQTLRGDEGEGLEKALITLWIGIYGFSAGIGTVLLLAANEQKRLLPKIVLGGYLLLLAAVIVSAVLGAK